MSVVVNQCIDVLSKALTRFAGEDKTRLVRPSEVMLIIALSDIDVEEPSVQNPIKRTKGHPFYRVIKQGQPYMRPRKLKVHPGQAMTDEVSFLQVLDAKLDFFQVEGQAKPFLMDAFARFTNELNEELQNNPDFQAYIAAQVKEQAGDKHPDEQKAIEVQLINENLYDVTDLEIWVVAPKLADRAGLPPNQQDAPVKPVPVLYAAGKKQRQLDFAKDIFQMAE
jgi:hypothetical protein